MGKLRKILNRFRIRRTVRKLLARAVDAEYRRLLAGPKPEDCTCMISKPDPLCPWHNRKEL